jgi:hypothetical protein
MTSQSWSNGYYNWFDPTYAVYNTSIDDYGHQFPVQGTSARRFFVVEVPEGQWSICCSAGFGSGAFVQSAPVLSIAPTPAPLPDQVR